MTAKFDAENPLIINDLPDDNSRCGRELDKWIVPIPELIDIVLFKSPFVLLASIAARKEPEPESLLEFTIKFSENS